MGHLLVINDADYSSVAIERVNTLVLKININGNGLVTLSCAGATSIYYTTDGTTPTSNSTRYNAPFSVAYGVTVKAIATNGLGDYSDVVSETYASLVENFKQMVPLTINEYGWASHGQPITPDNVSTCTPKADISSLEGTLRFTCNSGYNIAIWTNPEGQVAWSFFDSTQPVTINLSTATQIIVIFVPVPNGQVQTSTDWNHYCQIEQVV